MIFNEKMKQGMLGTIVIELAIAGILLVFLTDLTLERDITIILEPALVLLITLAGFEALVLLIHDRREQTRNNSLTKTYDPPV